MIWEVEIGCGKGKFLVARALSHPEIQFLGMDKAGRFMKRGAGRAEKKGLANLQFIKGDVREILKSEIAPEGVSVFHIYFPDPWPKRRHRHRRLLTPEFFRLLYDRLGPAGLIEVATDDPDYFSAIKKSSAESGVAWWQMRESMNERLFAAIDKTNYELKYQKEARPIYYLELQK